MFINKNPYVLYRDYTDFGYITDNSEYSYKKLSDNRKKTGEKIISASGSVFFSFLKTTPQHIDELLKKIVKVYADTDFDLIRKDAIEFYMLLEKDGFVFIDDGYEYSTIKPEQHLGSKVGLTRKEIEVFFNELYPHEYQLRDVHIEITSKCNERCLHCYIPDEYKLKSITPDLFYNIIKQCSEMKVLHVNISGGEPMMHKEFCNFIRECKVNNLSVNILSNLTLLNENVIAAMIDNPLLSVQTSLYSMNENIHDSITQKKGSFTKTKKAILRLIKEGVPLQISCPVINQNKDSYQDVVKWANENDIQANVSNIIMGTYDKTLDNLKCRMSLCDMEKFILDTNQYNTPEVNTFNANDFVCNVCNSSICINQDGDIYPCAGWQSYVIDNISNDRLINIWQNSKKIKELRGVRKKDFPTCITCESNEYCTMCMVRNANENKDGDPFILNNYFCDLTKLNHKLRLKKNNNNMY